MILFSVNVTCSTAPIQYDIAFWLMSPCVSPVKSTILLICLHRHYWLITEMSLIDDITFSAELLFNIKSTHLIIDDLTELIS